MYIFQIQISYFNPTLIFTFSLIFKLEPGWIRFESHYLFSTGSGFKMLKSGSRRKLFPAPAPRPRRPPPRPPAPPRPPPREFPIGRRRIGAVPVKAGKISAVMPYRKFYLLDDLIRLKKKIIPQKESAFLVTIFLSILL